MMINWVYFDADFIYIVWVCRMVELCELIVRIFLKCEKSVGEGL